MITLHHVYPVACTTYASPPGLGDYLRGSIALAHHARERGHALQLDFSSHPIGRFLRVPPPAPPVEAPFEEFFDVRATMVYDWLDELTPGSPARLSTNLLPHDSRIDDEICAIVRRQLDFEPAILEAAERLHRRIADDRFAVLHLRVADADFHGEQAASVPLFHYVETRIVPTWGRRIAVVSNNASMKKALSLRFGLPLIDTAAVHLGAHRGSPDGVRDTLIDFALLARASQIYSHSVYGWKSGFSHWCATLHGIPYERIELAPTKAAPRLRRWIQRTLQACETSP